jgi:hypothetical protein
MLGEKNPTRIGTDTTGVLADPDRFFGPSGVREFHMAFGIRKVEDSGWRKASGAGGR